MITHRDLKPHNILVEENDGTYRVRLLDYNIEQSFKFIKAIKNRYGSIYFQAPEVEAESYDQDCILWNIGVIAYLMLLGELPFDGHTMA
jgi:serine/threonine protein kinase